ncbi:hypothetical protein G4228_003887 [Cervus hanglu yarkandensis]|nr:hypothetical protein G4228_003887 [Cervus hanglu yarkandensis]
MAASSWRGVVLLRTVSGLWQPGPDAAREWIIRLPSLLGCQRRCVSCVAGPAFSGPRLASASRPNGQNSALDCFLGLSQPDNSPFRVPAVSVHRVVVLVDVSDKWTRNQLSPQLLRCLTQFSHVPSILVMNKVDCLKQKSVLLELTAALTEGVVNGKKLKTRQALRSQPGTHCPSPAAQGPDLQPARDPQRMGWPHFQEIFMLSALSQEDVKTLKQYLLAQAQPGPWEFHSEVLTSQTPEEICANMIREKLLEYLPKEVPYNIQQKTEVWDEGPSGELVIEQKLLVPKESHMKILIGPKGYLIAQIAQEVGRDLMNIFLCEVQLRLSVKLIK